MELSQIATSRLAWWGIQEVQESFRIAQSMRVRINPDDFRFFHVQGSHVRAYVNGEETQFNMTVDIDVVTSTMRIYIDSVYSLIRVDRTPDFELYDLDADAVDNINPDGTIEREVNFTEVKDRIPLWKSLPRNYDDSPINKIPKVVGGM